MASPGDAAPPPPSSSSSPRPPPPGFDPSGANYRRVRKATRTKNLLLGGFLGVVAFSSFAGQFYSYLKMKGKHEAAATSK